VFLFVSMLVANGMNAGPSSSSSSSPSSETPRLLVANRGGRRSNLLCAGGSESEDDSRELDSGEVSGSGCGDRVVFSTANKDGRGLGCGESERRCNVAWRSRGLVCPIFRDWTVVLAEDVRENGGAWGRPGVLGAMASFLGTGESLR